MSPETTKPAGTAGFRGERNVRGAELFGHRARASVMLPPPVSSSIQRGGCMRKSLWPGAGFGRSPSQGADAVAKRRKARQYHDVIVGAGGCEGRPRRAPERRAR
jgi:hypothetical protein